MRKVAVCLCLFGSALFAQTADVAYFRAVMLPSNEVPATTITAKGVADIAAHVVRDSSGQIIGGTVNFLVHVNFAADNTAVGLHIHSGGPTVAGPVVISSGLTAANTLPIKAASTVINLPSQVTTDSPAAALSALRGLFTDPANYYVNIHTTDLPSGAIRGQLVPAIATVLMGDMSQANEVPAITNTTASGTAVVVALATLDASGQIVTGETYQQTRYTTADTGNITGFHIHPGAAGGTGPASLQAPLPAGTALDPSGTGLIGPFYTEIDLTNAVQAQTFANLFYNPSGDYINMHTTQHGGGVMRAQLRNTDTMTFSVLMNSTNEVAKPTVAATAPALVTLHTVRNEDGTVAMGTVFFDVNYRFPGSATVSGLHIHDAAAGVNGAITIPMVPTYDPNFVTDSGFGNYSNWTPAVTTLAVLNDIVKNPEGHYVNIHTLADGGGVARAQLAAAVTTPGSVAAAIAANNDKTATTVAPGGLITIYGTNLAKVAVDLRGWAGKTIPTSLNGASVTIGGKNAPLIYVSSTQINAQVPVDVAAGSQPVVVNNGNGGSTAFNVTVAAAAPAIFFYGANLGSVLKNVDFSLVSASNPAKADDVILVYATGLGQTSPAIATGGIVASDAIDNTTTVTATIGGQAATVVYSIASPGFAGLYQVALKVPAGVTGSSPIVLTQGTVKSNSVNISVQ
jgi:uncharacterized protein (TIGR03437 family)